MNELYFTRVIHKVYFFLHPALPHDEGLILLMLYLHMRQGSGPVSWTYTGRKTFPPSTSFPVMGEIAGVNTASLGGYLLSTKTRARWAEGFHDRLNGQVFGLERDGLRQVVLCPRFTMR